MNGHFLLAYFYFKIVLDGLNGKGETCCTLQNVVTVLSQSFRQLALFE